MVLVKVLGLIDILAAATLFALAINWQYVRPLAYVLVGYIIIKAITFHKSWASILDFVVALSFGAMLYGYSMWWWLNSLLMVWLLQKGVKSLF